jgi:hypothetical protein
MSNVSGFSSGSDDKKTRVNGEDISVGQMSVGLDNSIV